MAVAANQLTKRQDGCRRSFPVAASTTLYEGTLNFITATGYLDDDTASGANRFAGIAIAYVANSEAVDGAKTAEVYAEGDFELVGTGFTQASVNLPVYATDNYTVTTSPSASGVYIGQCVGYVSSTKIIVAIDPDGTAATGNAGAVQTKVADYTVTAADSGRTFSTVGASGAVVFSMPPAVPGLRYRFYVGAAQELRIDPNGTETAGLPSSGVQQAAGAYLTANAAGETLDLQCVVAGSWAPFGYSGTWTAV